MLTIGELVSLDEQAQFRNDVQLDAFDNPVKNMALLRSYLFTASAPNTEAGDARSVSSVDLLEQLVQAFLSDRLENRLVTIANYGHGKSHLALALANLFSKPFDSPEVQLILSKLANAVTNSAKAARYRTFKESKGEFLVVRLRGDLTRNLHEQVIAGIERAIDEHPSIAGRRPNFWYSSAKTFLENLSGADRLRADGYLEQHSVDVPLLIRQIEERKDVYEVCVNLSKHLYQVPMNFGGEVGLKHLIDWTVRNCCMDNGSIAGILILFDEFSLYVDRYGRKGAAAELQDLLNGVDDHQGKVVFLAFAQHDPSAGATNMAGVGGAGDNLAKALTRLPKKLVLYSLMESVIDAYLKQNEDAWRMLLQNKKFEGSLYQASDVANEMFKGRYDRDLRWSFEKFQETISKGCFPLHPITTVLLCNLRFSAAGDIGVPRTVLGFVLEQLKRRKDELVVADGKVNWIIPAFLVDYFEPRLRGEHYSAYKKALQRLDPSFTPEHESILKGLLLQELAGIKLRGEEQVLFLAHCSGVGDKIAVQLLKALVDSRCIRYDQQRKVNSFIASDESPEALESLVAEKLIELPFDEQTALGILNDLKSISGISFASISVSVDWGEPSDWAAKQSLVPASFLTRNCLANQVEYYEPRIREVAGGERGAVIWIWASSEDELEWLRPNLASIVDQAFDDDTPVPAICMLPTSPLPELVTTYQRLRALNTFTQDEIQRVGKKIYEDELLTAKLGIVQTIGQLCGEESLVADIPRPSDVYCVPRAYRNRVAGLSKPTIKNVLAQTYRDAYRNAPPGFFRQYKLNASKLKNATKLVAGLLIENSPETLRTGIRTDNVAADLCSKFLQKEWGILTTDYRIQQPTSQPVARAWATLDAAFPPGCRETPVEDVLVNLLNPPNGYDHNTATLLFCAWFGYNRQDLQMSLNGTLANRVTLAQSLSTSPKDFINELCIQRPLSLARRDIEQIVKDIRILLDRIRREKFTQDEARQAVAALAEFSKDGRNNSEIRELAKNGATTLGVGIETAEEYDRQVKKILNALTSTDLGSLTGLLGQILGLPESTLVLSTAASPADVRSEVISRLTLVVEMDCTNYEKLEQLRSFDNNVAQLRTRRVIVERVGLATLVQRFDKAISTVNAKAEQLEIREREEALRVEINSFDVGAPLTRLLDARRRLEEISGLSEETMRLRNIRLQAVQNEIDTLERKAKGWSSEIDAITDLETLHSTHRELLQIINRYKGSQYSSTIDQVDQRILTLRSYLSDLGMIQNNLNGNIRTLADIAAVIQQMAELREKYRDMLSESQLKKLDEAIQEVKSVSREKEREAIVWLGERRTEYETNKNVVSLQRQIETPPAFLPEDAAIQLSVLRYEVQQKIDTDIVSSIEQKFRSIASVEQRRQCIERLQSLLDAN
jgi:hypothetical protein